MKLFGRVALLSALWLLAWGEISLANLVSGIIVASALFVVSPLGAPTRGRSRVSVIGFARLLAYVAVQLVVSNLVMAAAILRRNPTSRAGVVTHELDVPSEVVVTMMTSIIALSPGTMTVDVDDDASTIQVHFFALDDHDNAGATLSRLEQLVVAAVAATAPIPRSARTGEAP